MDIVPYLPTSHVEQMIYIGKARRAMQDNAFKMGIVENMSITRAKPGTSIKFLQIDLDWRIDNGIITR